MKEKESGKTPEMIREEAAAWAVRQGNYTLKDYYALPEERRVELIDGVIYDMASPSISHQYFITELTVHIRNYIGKKRGSCLVFPAPLDVQLDCDEYTVVQPDIMIICDRDKMKRSHLLGAPDFLAEIISPSSRSRDSNLKLKKYREAGVREYWMIDPDKERVVTYFFEQGDVPQIYGAYEEVPVRIFDSGLTIPFSELFEGMRGLGPV